MTVDMVSWGLLARPTSQQLLTLVGMLHVITPTQMIEDVTAVPLFIGYRTVRYCYVASNMYRSQTTKVKAAVFDLQREPYAYILVVTHCLCILFKTLDLTIDKRVHNKQQMSKTWEKLHTAYPLTTMDVICSYFLPTLHIFVL